MNPLFEKKKNPLLSNLNDDEVQAILRLENAIQEQKTYVVLSKKIVPQRIMQLYKLTLSLVPEIILYDSSRLSICERSDSYYVSLLKSRKNSDEIIRLEMISDDIINKKELKGKSEIIRTVEIFNYLSSNVEYGESSNAHNALGALIDNKAVCEGIALAFCLLAKKCDIYSACVGGELNGEPHAWNIVWVNKQSYHIDVTSSLKANTDTNNYDYLFLKDEDLFNRKWDKTLFPRCTSDDCNYFFLSKSYARTHYEAIEIIIRQLRKKKIVYFRMAKCIPVSFDLAQELFFEAYRTVSKACCHVEIQLNPIINSIQIKYT